MFEYTDLFPMTFRYSGIYKKTIKNLFKDKVHYMELGVVPIPNNGWLGGAEHIFDLQEPADLVPL